MEKDALKRTRGSPDEGANAERAGKEPRAASPGTSAPCAFQGSGSPDAVNLLYESESAGQFGFLGTVLNGESALVSGDYQSVPIHGLFTRATCAGHQSEKGENPSHVPDFSI